MNMGCCGVGIETKPVHLDSTRQLLHLKYIACIIHEIATMEHYSIHAPKILNIALKLLKLKFQIKGYSIASLICY